MSRSVDLFVGFKDTIAALAKLITELTGLSFNQDPSGSWLTTDESFQAVLSDNTRSGFSAYQFTLTASVSEEGRLQEAPATIMLRLVADQLQRQPGLPVLLVMDLQYREQPVAAVGSSGVGSSRVEVGDG